MLFLQIFYLQFMRQTGFKPIHSRPVVETYKPFFPRYQIDINQTAQKKKKPKNIKKTTIITCLNEHNSKIS